jgi:hypothetical protein
MIELTPADGGASLMIHPAAKSQKMGQALVKLAFDVEDVAAFCAKTAARSMPLGDLPLEGEMPGKAEGWRNDRIGR